MPCVRARVHQAAIDVLGPVTDPLSRAEPEDKARQLAEFRDGALPEEIERIIERSWNLDREPDVRNLLVPER